MLFFERDQELYISTVTSGFTVDNTVKIAALAGVRLDQKSITTSVYNYKVNDNDRLEENVILGESPPTLSFSAYIKPNSNNIVERLLLYSLTGSIGTLLGNTTTFEFININTIPKLFVYLKYNNIIFKISSAVVKSLEIDLNINQIITGTWELTGLDLEKVNELPNIYTDFTNTIPKIASNFTTVKLSDSIELPIISGKLKFTNNIQTISRNVLGARSIIYLDHRLESRNTSLKFIGYLKTGSNLQLFQNLKTNLDYIADNDINCVLTIGKKISERIEVVLNKPQIEVPTINIQDVISSNINITSRKYESYKDDTIIKYIGV